MTIREQINLLRKQHPHPLEALIGNLPELTFVVRNEKHYKWVNSIESGAEPCTTLQFTRLGTNLYDYASGESLGVPIDVDGGSHTNGLTPEQLSEIRSRLPDYVSLCCTSTSGTGLHVYLLWTHPVPCSPSEHRLLCKRAAEKLQQDVGLPYKWIDVSTNILWTVARDAGAGAFTGTPTAGRLNPDTLPPLPPLPGKQGPPPELNTPVRVLMERAKGTPYACEWLSELGCVRTHKGLLLDLQQEYPGDFHTNSPCTDPSTANCWLRWDADGYFNVYAWGDSEHPSWLETSGGYLHTTFGKPPSFAQANTGVPESDTCYRYSESAPAIEAIRKLTGITIALPESLQTPRQFAVVKKGSVYHLRAYRYANETCPPGWVAHKDYFWIGTRTEETHTAGDVQRISQEFFQTHQSHRLTGLYRCTGSRPVLHTREQAYSVARHQAGSEGPALIDKITTFPVELVSEAFAPIIQPGKLNVGPQLVVQPAPGRCDTWLSMLLRLGESLTPSLVAPDAPWADWVRRHRLTSGGRYLLWWIAFLVQNPTQRLPILAFVGPRNSGKSTFADSLQTLWDTDGTSDAGELLRRGSQFTGNVSLSVLARIEDCDISRREQLLRLTPWVTQPRMLAEFKHQTPFTVANQTHFVVETNHPKDIPIHDQDCRFVVIEVSSLTQRDVEFTRKLEAEAPAFLNMVLNVKLPAREEHFGRLALPDVSTAMKEEIAESNLTSEEMFANECLKEGDGFVSNSELWDAFGQWCHRTRKVNQFSDSQEFVRALGSWFTGRGIPSERRSIRGEKLRGRSGVQLKA